MDVIAVDKLVKRYGDKLALDGVSLAVKEGTFFGCFGPNGAGKSTLLRILTGQIQPTSGQATVLGLDCRTQGIEIKKLVGIVPEVESPPSYLTASEFLCFAGRLRGVEDLEKKVDRWLDFFDLQEARGTLCRDLSKGMRQKVMLASAFIHEPKLLFLDEPFINLDPIYQRKLREYLLGAPLRGPHDLPELPHPGESPNAYARRSSSSTAAGSSRRSDGRDEGARARTWRRSSCALWGARMSTCLG